MVSRCNRIKSPFIVVIKYEIPGDEVNKNLQNLCEKIKILLKNTEKTWTNVKEYHTLG